jgi:hypothetical protein
VDSQQRFEKTPMIRNPQVEELVNDDEILEVIVLIVKIDRERDSACR